MTVRPSPADSADDAVDAPADDRVGHGAEQSEVDRDSLRRLRHELNDDAVVDHFVSDFLELLDERLLSLGRMLQLGRVEDAVTMLLSIETSSLMVGANHLASTAAVLRRAVGCGNPGPLAQLYQELIAAGERAKLMLAGG